MIQTLALVALGGAIGASLRFLTVLLAVRLFGAGFPWGTLAVNVAGSFAIGVCFVLLAPRDPRLAPFLVTGILGGFTTFSAFSLDAFALYERGAAGAALTYVAASVVLSLAAVAAGLAFARSVAG